LPNLQANDDDQVSDNTPGGKARAEANLGWDYEVGYQRPVNYKKAMELYQKAAADGDATANWNIARMYEFGFGVPKDFDKARYWYDKATAAGEPRGQLYKDNIGKNQPYVDTK
jgi:TPR repeat protein